MSHVFKILTGLQWTSLRAKGSFAGSLDDLRDGFIHLSSEQQVAGSLEKHFAGQSDLILLKLDPGGLGAQLRVELSRGGKEYPHLYRDLVLADILEQTSAESWLERRNCKTEG